MMDVMKVERDRGLSLLLFLDGGVFLRHIYHGGISCVQDIGVCIFVKHSLSMSTWATFLFLFFCTVLMCARMSVLLRCYRHGSW